MQCLECESPAIIGRALCEKHMKDEPIMAEMPPTVEKRLADHFNATEPVPEFVHEGSFKYRLLKYRQSLFEFSVTVGTGDFDGALKLALEVNEREKLVVESFKTALRGGTICGKK